MISLTSLAANLYELQGFQKMYKPLYIKSIQDQFPILDEEIIEINLDYLYVCASILAESENPEHLDTAYRIAQFGLKINKNYATKSVQIFKKMTNHPSITLAINKGYVSQDFENELTLYQKIDNANRDLQYSIWDETEDRILYLNKFQSEVMGKIYHNQILSISAPTSAGKSFILLYIIKSLLKDALKFTLIYVVPTRALVNQVEFDFRKNLNHRDFDDVYISSMPIIDELISLYPKKIFVLTQERLQWLLNENEDITIDYLIVDEAQKVSDGSRGVILQQTIEETLYRSKGLKVIYSSPLTKNPEVFFENNIESKLQSTVEKEFVSVNQNLLWVNAIYRKPKEWEIKVCRSNDVIQLGKINFQEKPNGVFERLVYVVDALGDPTGGNLVYAKRPDDAEKIAELLYEKLPNMKLSSNVTDLIELIQSVISEKFTLIKYLKKGIAYHYGNIPLIIKTEIERLFKEGEIKFLICTATLIEGVNLPAKTIFIRSAKKGNSTPMSEVEFWNLAGRAGRQGIEFQGNIVCIDTNNPKVWETPPQKRSKYEIEFFSKKILKEQYPEILSYILNDMLVLDNHNLDYEHILSYLLKDYLNRGNLRENKILEDLIEEEVIQLENALESILSKVDIPKEILIKHSGINPFAQQKIKNFFTINISRLEKLELVSPTMQDSKKRYELIIRILHKAIPFDDEKRLGYLSSLVVDWMNGIPLNFIINKSLFYWRNREDKTSQQVIRGSLKDIEEFARFLFIKYISCYKDLLDVVKRENGLNIESDNESVNLWLELGASDQTTLSIIGLGINRSTAIEIAKQIDNKNLTRTQVVDFLPTLDLSKFNKIMVREIVQVIDFYFEDEKSS